jgi:hypothetical protein
MRTPHFVKGEFLQVHIVDVILLFPCVGELSSATGKGNHGHRIQEEAIGQKGWRVIEGMELRKRRGAASTGPVTKGARQPPAFPTTKMPMLAADVEATTKSAGPEPTPLSAKEASEEKKPTLATKARMVESRAATHQSEETMEMQHRRRGGRAATTSCPCGMKNRAGMTSLGCVRG